MERIMVALIAALFFLYAYKLLGGGEQQNRSQSLLPPPDKPKEPITIYTWDELAKYNKVINSPEDDPGFEAGWR